MPWVFRCFFACRAFAPSLRRARFHDLDHIILLPSVISSMSLRMLVVHFTLPGGCVPATACTSTSFQYVLAVISFGGVRAGSKHSAFWNLVRIWTTGLVCVESLCHVFSVLLTC